MEGLLETVCVMHVIQFRFIRAWTCLFM